MMQWWNLCVCAYIFTSSST